MENIIPTFIRGLSILKRLLRIANTQAKKRKFPVERLLEARLAPDMFSLIGQVQYAYFTALEAAEVLLNKKQPTMKYDETTVDDLLKSLQKVTLHLQSIKRTDKISYDESVHIETYLHPGKKISRDRYLHHYALPNFYFHIATAYDILRHNGVSLSKDEYLGITQR